MPSASARAASPSTSASPPPTGSRRGCDLVRNCVGRKSKRRPKPLSQAMVGPAWSAKVGDEAGLGHRKRGGIGGALAGRAGALGDQVGVEGAAAVLRQMGLEVVGDLGLALHPEIGLGVAALATPLRLRGAFQHRHPRTGLGGRHGGRKPGDAATGNHHLETLFAHPTFPLGREHGTAVAEVKCTGKGPGRGRNIRSPGGPRAAPAWPAAPLCRPAAWTQVGRPDYHPSMRRLREQRLGARRRWTISTNPFGSSSSRRRPGAPPRIGCAPSRQRSPPAMQRGRRIVP